MQQVFQWAICDSYQSIEFAHFDKGRFSKVEYKFDRFSVTRLGNFIKLPIDDKFSCKVAQIFGDFLATLKTSLFK